MGQNTDQYITNGGQHGTARPSGNGGTKGGTRRVTMADAARTLGISKEAVRKRVQRGTLRSDVGEDGRRYVYLDDGRDDDPRNYVTEVDPRDELVATLKDQLDAERNAHAETRRIAYALAQHVPELEASPTPRETPQAPAADNGGVGGRPTTEGAQEAAQPRSWWRRWFGFE